MKNHFINIGIKSEREDILIKLLQFENNLSNASSMTGLNIGEIEKIIEEHELFKSEITILNRDKIKMEMELIDFEILIESVVINWMEDYEIEDYMELTGFDNEIVTRIYELNQEYRPKLCEFLEYCGFKLMDIRFSYEEVGDISGTIIFHGSLDEYY